MKKKDLIKKIGSATVSFFVSLGMLAPPGAMLAATAESAMAAQTAPVFKSAKNYGGKDTDCFQDVAYTNDGGFVAMGYTMGDSEDPKWTYHPNGNSHANNDAVLIKFNKDHEIEWTHVYGGKGVFVFNGMTILKDGRIGVIGRAPSDKTDQSKLKGVSWYILLIDPENPENYGEHRIGGTLGDQGCGISATSDGGFTVTGWVASTSGYWQKSTDGGDTYSDPVQLWEPQKGTDEEIPNRISGSSSDTVVVKFDKDENIKFTALHQIRIMDHPEATASPQERVEDIVTDENDDIIIAGSNKYTKYVTNAFIAKLDGKTGKVLWHRAAGNDTLEDPSDPAYQHKDVYSAVDVLNDGSYVVTGSATNDAATEEGWDCVSQKDALAVHYSSTGKLINAESFGVINDGSTRMETIMATKDGGYIIGGSASGVMREDEEIDKGYNWGSYGTQDAILVKYNSNDKVVWSKNYGTSAGDWINGLAEGKDGEVIAAGESNGKYGVPAWNNNGDIDGILMCTGEYKNKDSYTEPVSASSDGAVTWADGTYQASGDGYKGTDSIRLSVTIENNIIKSVVCDESKDTKSYYKKAAVLYDQIVEKQTADVDVVSGATMSSNGIRQAAKNALSKSAAKSVDVLIKKIEKAEDQAAEKAAAQTAADAYSELGTLAVSELKNSEALKTAASTYGIELKSREDVAGSAMRELLPVKSSGGRFNDTYYKLQKAYYDDINMESLPDSKLTGKGVKVAVIDSGITPAHKDIDYGRILEGYDYDTDKAMNAGEGSESLLDVNGHGTAVTGIIAAKQNNKNAVAGLLSNVEIIPLKLIPSTKASEKESSSKKVARAVRDAVDKYDADVITTSLDVIDTQELADAVKYAAEKDVIVTGAAGNTSNNDISQPDAYIYPAAYEDVISVGATDQNGTVRANSTKNDQVFVTAPGEDIALLDISRNSRSKISSGTSYASPVVAALAAAAKQAKREQTGKDLTVGEFKKLLEISSNDAGGEGYDIAYGYGTIDFKKFTDAIAEENTVTLDKTELEMDVKTSENLKAKVVHKWMSESDIEWSSSDDSVATVDQNGKITSVAAGTAKITAKSKNESGKKAECKVIVIDYAADAEKAKKKMIASAKSVKVKIKSKALKKFKVRLSWKKAANADGYEIWQSVKTKTKFRKTATIKKVKIMKWNSKKLKKKTRYFYKVRTYKKIGGKTYYGKWSNTVKVTTKK